MLFLLHPLLGAGHRQPRAAPKSLGAARRDEGRAGAEHHPVLLLSQQGCCLPSVLHCFTSTPPVWAWDVKLSHRDFKHLWAFGFCCEATGIFIFHIEFHTEETRLFVKLYLGGFRDGSGGCSCSSVLLSTLPATVLGWREQPSSPHCALTPLLHGNSCST